MEKFRLELLQRERELWTVPTGKSIHNSLARTSHMASPNSKWVKKWNSSTSLPPRQGRGWSEECSSGCRFPAITWVRASPVYSTSQCGTGPRDCNQGESSTMGRRCYSVLGQCLGGAAAIVGVYSSSASEAAQNSDGGGFNTAHTPIHAKSPCGPTCPVVWLHNRAGGSGACEEWSAMRDRGNLDPRLCLNRARETL